MATCTDGEMADVICPTCDGEKEVICNACNGSGEGYVDGSHCTTCGGSGVRPCPYCREDD